MPGFGGFGRGWNMPRSAKRPEVVEPNQINMCQQRLKSVNAPAITRAEKRFPVIHRVTPELSFGAEIIRRYAGNELWPEIRIEMETLRIGPNIARIERH